MAKVGARKIRCIRNMEDKETDLSVAFKEFGEKVSEAMIPVVKAISNIANAITKTFVNVWEQIKPNLDKSISRKRFIKLLMSQGVQRNEANKIAWKIHKKKGKYTIYDYLLTIKNKED